MRYEDQKIGIIAGGGNLPHAVIQAAGQSGAELYVIALKGAADAADFQARGDNVGIAEFGKITKLLKAQGCHTIVFAGYVKRPDFKSLKPDLKAVKYIPGVIKAANLGDDALLRFLVRAFEKEGFEVVSPQEICRNLLLPVGPFGRVRPNGAQEADIERAMKIAAVVGASDIGQGAVVCDGLVLAVEAQEGTDAMLERVATLDPELRGRPEARRGVLAKRLKPGQEERVDLPTIGPDTVAKAAAAGLAGIALEAGKAFVIQGEQVMHAANQLGLFIVGIEFE